MTLNHASLTRAARKRASRAKEKARSAEVRLAAIADTLEAVVPAESVAAVEEVTQQAAVAQQEVHAAVEELEVVTELLSEAARPAGGPGHSGEGLSSLLPHLRSQRDSSHNR
jgi:hypothetical protein